MEKEDKTYINLADPSSLTTAQIQREISSLKELLSNEIENIKREVKAAHDDYVRVPTEVQKASGTLKELHDEKFRSYEKQLVDFEKDVFSRFADMEKLRDEKFGSVMNLLKEKDIALNSRFVDVLGGIDNKFEDNEKLREEKFSGVEKQFKERDTRIEQTSKDSKVAVDAALQAAKELVAQQNISISQANTKQEASFSKQIDAQGLLIIAITKNSDEKIGDLKDRVGKIDSKMMQTEGVTTGKKDNTAAIIAAIGVAATIIAIISYLATHVIK